MDKYIEIHNQNNIVQLNDHYENIAYCNKSHPKFIRSYDYEGTVSMTMIPYPKHYSFWFLHNNSDKEIKVGMVKEGSGKDKYRRYLLFKNENNDLSKEFIENNIDLYWFDIGGNPKHSDYGLEIYSKKQKLIYSSAQQYLRIEDTIGFAEGWSDNVALLKNIKWSGEPTKKYAIHLGSNPSYIYKDSDEEYVRLCQIFAVIGPHNKYIGQEMIEFNSAYYGQHDDAFEKETYRFAAWTIADITGL